MSLTLNKITTDLLNIVRNANPSRSETVSKSQIEHWVHQYRALLLKRDLDKNKEPHPDYVQEFNGLALETVEAAGDNDLASGTYLLRTELALPKFLDLNDRIGITYVGTVVGREIQLMSQQRTYWQGDRKYSNKTTVAYIKGSYLYIRNCMLLRYITIRGILEDPTVATDYADHTGITSYTVDTTYPIPLDKVPILKQMILEKELGITVASPSDVENDSLNKVEPVINR